MIVIDCRHERNVLTHWLERPSQLRTACGKRAVGDAWERQRHDEARSSIATPHGSVTCGSCRRVLRCLAGEAVLIVAGLGR